MPARPRSNRFPCPDDGIPPGPDAGRVWREAPAAVVDPCSGRVLVRLTAYRGHSHHLAGAMPCWLDGGRRLVVVSDREGRGNLFVYDFSAAMLTQLTDLRAGGRPGHATLVGGSRLSFRYGPLGYELDLISLRIRPTGRPAGRTPRPAPPLAVGETLLSARRRLLWLAAPVGAPGRPRALVLLRGDAALRPAQPCLSPDGTRVVFAAADAAGYTQIFTVDARVPASLPPAPLRVRAASGPRSTRPRA